MEEDKNLQFRNLFITGNPGVGKTFYSKEILKQAIKFWNNGKKEAGQVGFSMPDGEDVYKFYGCNELMMYARVPREAIEYYEKCSRLKGLILDDLGMGKKSDFVPDIIYMIIDKRLELGKPTIVTTNLRLEEISELIDDRLASRLGSFEYMEMKGEDKRIKNP
ncbi:MAG: hypothetical protein ACP5NS_05000 [Candidatus Pacearchaeota archaeon]